MLTTPASFAKTSKPINAAANVVTKRRERSLAQLATKAIGNDNIAEPTTKAVQVKITTSGSSNGLPEYGSAIAAADAQSDITALRAARLYLQVRLVLLISPNEAAGKVRSIPNGSF